MEFRPELGFRVRTCRGFSLVEAAVAICVVAILAGMIVPLAVKVLDQQREGRTRESLKVAFEALFGARDRRVANLRADIGFNPTSSLNDLSILVAKNGASSWSSTAPGATATASAWNGTKSYGQDTTTGLFWGYNGPYWNGSTVINSPNTYPNEPVDGWGRALRLKVAAVVSPATYSWQVYSLGVNGVDENGGGDDLVYPSIPAYATSYSSVLNLNISLGGSRSGNVTVYSRNPTGTTLTGITGITPPNTTVASPYNFTTVTTLPQLIYNPPAGGVVVRVVITTGAGATYYYVMDLMPGEIRDYSVGPL